MSDPLLELRGVNKSFGVVHVLHDVDFAVYPGQVTALVGDNGAGKSTLVKIIAGIYGRDSGDYLYDGKPVEVHGPSDIAAWASRSSTRTSRSATTWTSPRTCSWAVRSSRPACSTSRPWRPGHARRWPPSRCGPSSRSASRWRASPAASARRWPSPRRSSGTPRSCSSTSRPQRWASPQTRQVLDLVRRLADNGLGVVLISHNMTDVFEVADRITALYLGRVAADVPTKDVNHSQVVELITAGRSGNPGHFREPRHRGRLRGTT